MKSVEFVEKVLKDLGVRMENEEKVDRAVNGMATSRGRVDGVGESATSEVILAKYDQLGGYITKGGFKVKNGCFFDAVSKAPVKKPVVFLIKVNGEVVEQVEDAPEPIEVKVAKKVELEKREKKSRKVRDEE